jgi:hypothetical protein
LLVEFALAKVVTDLGVIGACTYLWLFFALIRKTLGAERSYHLAGDTESAGFAAVVAAIQIMAVVTGYDLGVIAVTLWLLSGAALSSVRDSANNSSARASLPLPKPLRSEMEAAAVQSPVGLGNKVGVEPVRLRTERSGPW